jgi:pimeloyl-ACP methyl ester carboxylesterase
LLQHGLESDASQWVLNVPSKAPAFNLVDAGYDVWMGNNRGCAYSVMHKTLDPNSKHDAAKYWDFDYEDMGMKDLNAEIDFILSATGQTSVSYVGHSEGTTQMFIALTE